MARPGHPGTGLAPGTRRKASSGTSARTRLAEGRPVNFPAWGLSSILRFIYHHRTQGRGGEGVHIAHVVRALEALGHDVTVVSPPGVDPLGTAGMPPVDKSDVRVSGLRRVWKWVSRHLPQLGFEVLELGYNVFALTCLHGVLRERSRAVLYERYAFFLVLSTWLAKRRGIPVMLEVNEVAGVPRARGLTLEGLARWSERVVLRRADAVLVVSGFLADEARRRGARPERVHIVPNAVETATPVSDAERARTRAALGFRGETVIGFLGWFDRWDRLDLLVDVFGTLHAARPDTRLLLVGDGPETPALRERIARRGLDGAVVLTGPVPRAEVPRHLGAMDIGVLPASNAFGSPIALFEMMAAGRAVVAPDVGPVRDVLEDGVTGLIAPPGDPERLGAALDRLVADAGLRTRLGTAAQRKIAAEHTWAVNAQRIVALAEQCAERNA